jgi:PKD repeat protein
MSGSPAKKIITIGVLIAIIALLAPFSVSCSKPPAPVAAFTASYVSGERLIEDPIAGTIPLTVRFSDQSSGEITSWRWNFGDGIVIQGSGGEYQNPEHTYLTTNTGFMVALTVQGPGGKNQHVETEKIITVFQCSEAANSELNQARGAIQACMGTAKTLDKYGVWDGKSRGIVVAGGRDAADYLGVWKTFKAAYDVDVNGDITSGTDVSWACVYWNPNSLGGARWTKIGG